MKDYIVVLLSIMTFTSYSMGDNALDRKINTNSNETFKKSMLEIKKDLSKEDFEAFQKGLMPIIFRSSLSAAITVNKDEDKNEVKNKAIRIAIQGKTPREIIALGVDTSEDNTDTETEKDKVKILKIGESVVYSDVEIIIQGVSIGQLKSKYESSYFRVPKDKFLLIRVQFKNLSEGKIRTIVNPWKSSTNLQDNFENYYRVKSEDNAADTISYERIKPGKTLTDTIIFEVPLENAKEFTLISTPTIYKAKGNNVLEKLPTGELHLKFNRLDIK